jgi:hypothetical protein
MVEAQIWQMIAEIVSEEAPGTGTATEPLALDAFIVAYIRPN